MNWKSIKKIATDSVINIVSVVLGTAVLQLVILPQVANAVSDDEYGTMLTIVSVIQLLCGAAGSALNNTRLVRQHIEEKKGSYNLLTIVLAVVCSIAVCVYCSTLEHEQTPAYYIYIVLLSVLILLSDYYFVYYRLNLNYTRVFISSLISSAAYFVGFFMFKQSGIWQFIYIIAYAVSVIIVAVYGKPWREGLKVDKEFKPITISVIILLMARFLGRISMYADKIVLYGLLGGGAVSIYYISSLLGKCLSMVISPLNNVVLSYICNSDKSKNRAFNYTLIVGGIFSLLFYLFTIVAEQPFLKLIYPQYAAEAIKYMYVTNLTAVVMALVSMLEPFILRYCKMSMQLVINGGASILYLGLTILFGSFGGLMGFCLGCAIAYIFRLLLVIIIFKCNKAFKEEQKSEC